MTQQTAQIHRFRDKVAVHLGTGNTVYLEPREAVLIATHLLEFGIDIKKTEFKDSEIGTYTIEFNGEK